MGLRRHLGYFVANLVYLQMVCSRLVINLSLASLGRDVFESATWLVPLLGVASCLGLTYLSTRGVRVFSRFAGIAGRVVLVSIFGLILVSVGAVVFGCTRGSSCKSRPGHPRWS